MTDYFVGRARPSRRRRRRRWLGLASRCRAGSLLAYVDVFWTLMLLALGAIPLALILRKVKLGGPAPAGH